MTQTDPEFGNADGATLKHHAGELFATRDYANAAVFLQRAIDKGDLPGDELAKAYYDLGLCAGLQNDAATAYPHFYKALTVSDHYVSTIGVFQWFFWASTGGTWPTGMGAPDS